LRARELRNGQSGEGQCQATAVVAKGFPVDVPQPRCYHIRRNGEYQKGNRDQEPAGVNSDPRIRGRNGDVCNRCIPLRDVSARRHKRNCMPINYRFFVIRDTYLSHKFVIQMNNNYFLRLKFYSERLSIKIEYLHTKYMNVDK